MINLKESLEKFEAQTKELEGQCIVLEEKDGWYKCQTISTGKIWETPIGDIKDRIIVHDDNSFSFQRVERKSPF